MHNSRSILHSVGLVSFVAMTSGAQAQVFSKLWDNWGQSVSERMPDIGFSGYYGGAVSIPAVDYADPRTVDFVKKYHADPTGAIDATAALIQALHDLALAPDGGILYFRNGHYRLEDSTRAAIQIQGS